MAKKRIKNGLSMSPKRTELIKYLLEIRVATKKQLAYGLYGFDLSEEELQKKLGALSLRLNEFYNANLVQSHLPNHSSYRRNAEKFFYLTNEGYNYVTKELLGLRNKKGSGFNDDLGIFEYGLYRPGLNNIVHTLLQSEVHVIMKNLREELDKRVDYRNNLYAAQPYEDMNLNQGRASFKTFRPDGEILLQVFEQKEYEDLLSKPIIKVDGDKVEAVKVDAVKVDHNIRTRELRLLVEVDTGSERGRHLTDKAEQYKNYFKYLRARGEELPDGILFITPQSESTETGFNLKKELRFQSLYRTFQELTDTPKGEKSFNIYCLGIDELKQSIELLAMQVRDVQEKVQSALSYVTPMIPANIRSNISATQYNNDLTPVVYKGPAKTIHWIFLNAEGLQTRPWELALDYYQKAKSVERSSYERVTVVVNVIFYYSKFYSQIPKTLEEIKRTANIATLPDNMYFFNLLEEQWYDSAYQKLSNFKIDI